MTEPLKFADPQPSYAAVIHTHYGDRGYPEIAKRANDGTWTLHGKPATDLEVVTHIFEMWQQAVSRKFVVKRPARPQGYEAQGSNVSWKEWEQAIADAGGSLV